MTRPLDIAIAGCGPGGLATALILGRAGHRVRLFERFHTPQPVGSGLMLQPTGLAVLDRLGLGTPIRSLGRRIDRLAGRAVPSGRVVLDVRLTSRGPGSSALAIHRAAAFNLLHEAACDAGLSIETGVEIAGLDRGADRRPSLVAAGGRRIGPFDLVVDALGSRSPLQAEAFGRLTRRPLAYGALWSHLPWPAKTFDEHALEQRYRKASIMVGVLPIGRRHLGDGEGTAFFWSIKSAEHDAFLARGLGPWRDEVRALWPETAPLVEAIRDPEQLTLARYGHHTLTRPYGDRLAIVGDSAHATSPQLGQGCNMALLDAYALGLALDSAGDLGTALTAYARLRRLHVRLYQAMSLIFTPFYQSDGSLAPLVRDHLVPPLSALPPVQRALAALVTGAYGAPLRRLGLRLQPR